MPNLRRKSTRTISIKHWEAASELIGLQGKWFGFDSAFFIDDPMILDYFLHKYHWHWHHHLLKHRHIPGVVVNPELLDELLHVIDKIPPARFRFNLFLQYKRPEYVKSPLGGEYDAWGIPYFRYYPSSEQQEMLERLEIAASSNAVVSYASPAFHLREELFNTHMERLIVEKSNYVGPSRLKGHHCYTYVEPGASGKAFSDPEDIEDEGFDRKLSRARESNQGQNEGVRVLVKQAGRMVSQALQASNIDTRNAFREAHHRIMGRIMESVESSGDMETYSSFVNVQTFCFLNKTAWSLVG
ncbi:MAG: hypothetical protein HQL77_00720 [Magnetococcales bacterium]|nr:hypothetical protein [Magnetococcales bacterium]